MIKHAQRKLRSRKGESIGETLVALLISALALLMLAGAVSSAANIVTTSKNKMETYYTADNSAVEEIRAKWASVFSDGSGALTPDSGVTP